MDSPIIILVFWVLVNLLLKSSRDKKKAERARRKTGQGSSQTQQRQRTERSRMNTGMKDFRQALEEYKAQIEKELNPEKKPPAKAPAAQNRQRVDKPDSRLEKSGLKTFREGRYWEDANEDKQQATSTKDSKEAEVAATQKKPETEKASRGLFDIKNDILKGVVYSEILDKPRSLRSKRGPF